MGTSVEEKHIVHKANNPFASLPETNPPNHSIFLLNSCFIFLPLVAFVI